MNTKSNDNLAKALSLLKKTARSAQAARRLPNASGPLEIGELFLADLRIRRAHLREWIDVLNSEAGKAALGVPSAAAGATPRACRHHKAARAANKV